MPFKSEKQRRWMWANNPEMAKKWEKKEKKMKETKVKQLIKKLVREIVTEAKRMNYKERDWKKINKIAKRKDVFIQTSYGDQFKWEEGSNYGVFATEEDGREIELDHDDIDVVMVEGKLSEKKNKGLWANIHAKRKRGESPARPGDEDYPETLDVEAMSRRVAGKTLKIPQPGDFGNDMDKYFKALNKHMKEVEKLAKIQKKKGIKESGIMYRAGVKKYGKEGMKKIQSAAGKGADHAEIGAIKDKYDKKKKNEGKLKEGFDLKKLEDAIKVFQSKIKKQGNVTNARDEEHLEKLIKVYKEMGGKKIKEGKLNEKMDRKKAAIILKQIGGNRFIAMTGAKGFAFSDKYMSFKIGRNSKGINFVRIGHNAKDLYDMEFGFVSTRGIKVKKKVKDVYADMLGQIFKKHTGMNVSL